MLPTPLSAATSEPTYGREDISAFGLQLPPGPLPPSTITTVSSLPLPPNTTSVPLLAVTTSVPPSADTMSVPPSADTMSVPPPSNKRKIHTQQTPSKRRRCDDEGAMYTVTSYKTQRGKSGLKVGGASFKLQRKRKTDNILAWKCYRCDCGMETTEALSLIKHPQHKRTCSHNSDTRPSTMEAAVTDADTAPEPHFVETTRKKTALLFEKHLYHKATETLWRCAQRQSMNCKAGCHIIDNKVSSNQMIHTHEPLSDEKIKLLDIIVDVKRKAVEQPDEKPLHILASSIKNSFESGPTGLKNHDVSNIRQTIYRTRRRTFRSVPTQRRSCLRRLKEMASSVDEIVRSVRGNIVMIARKEDLKLLNVDRLALFGDGTFKYSPRFFNQMYTFFVFTNGFYKQPQKEDGFGECSGSLS